MTVRLRSPRAPSLLNAPTSYQGQYHDQMNNALRLYYHQIDNLTQALLGEVGTAYIRAPYGVFSSSTTQTAAAINTVYALTFDITTYTNAVAVSSPTSRLLCDNSGVYAFDFTGQVGSTSGATGSLYVWAAVNGTGIASTGTRKTVRIPNPEEPLSRRFTLELVGGDYVELFWAVSDTGVRFLAEAAIAAPYVRPAIPSVSLTTTYLSASI
jgi:hypothetical protein